MTVKLSIKEALTVSKAIFSEEMIHFIVDATIDGYDSIDFLCSTAVLYLSVSNRELRTNILVPYFLDKLTNITINGDK